MSNTSSASNRVASFINSVRNRRSVSPVVQRLLELCVHYQQQQQNNQNNLASPSSSNVNPIDLNEQSIRKIKHLFKKIPKPRRNSSIEELERAVLHKDSRTRCVTIRKSSDDTHEQSSRLNPVIESCRLWRWSDLLNQDELKPVDYCPNAVHYGLDNICVNPYHYERVPSTYSVHVPRLPPEAVQSIPDIHPPSISDAAANQVPENRTYETPFQSQSSPSLSPDSIASQDSFHSPCSGVNNDENVETVTPMDLDIILIAQSNPPREVNFASEQVELQQPREWCRLSYYEFSARVGEQYPATQSQVIIDGFTHPSNADRFCLGGLTNIDRTLETHEVRRSIGRGVKLYHIRGNVFAECLSANPVFVQSPIANKRFSWHPATVCKIPSNVRLQIFDNDEFTQILASAIHEGYESVYNLTKMCIIRMSLVKGWGVDYRRKSVTNTPCWIEIFLDGPLKWLDSVLFTMRGPNQSITSVS
ncbi:unnamed protein product [Rotaria magnacalcarata]|uniref:Mothers against decapentaplegic homolog n=1 Tax=Rotaria magnacalcarata TaxID=392030 RepID=A0A816R2Q9_9BILA|nr:unnamed protein product [Rotaria magnacalcarata]CAF4035313.1 unnamed protein product [Rotaria magnacalcarata]